MTPGWYPDPFSDGLLRWWDGTTWTARTVPNAPMGWAFLPDPRADLAGEQTAGRRASIALLAGIAVTGASSVGSALVFGRFWSQLRHDLDQPVGTTPRVPTFGAAQLALTQLAGVAQLAVQILLMIWLYKAATLAQRAGVPARRDPVWAIIGFLVPVVNLWFPYQVAAGCFPPTHPLRSSAARWWAWTIVQYIVVAAVIVATVFSQGAALVVAAVGIVVAVMTAREGRVMIASIASAHGELVEDAGRRS